MTRAIRTKAEYLRLSGLGLLGNRMPSWDTVEDALASGHRGEVMVRYREANSPYMTPNVPLADAPSVIDGLVARGAERSKLYLTWMSPYVGRRLNAEAWHGPRGLYLHYSTLQTHLREALDTAGKHAEGVVAREVLRWACCPNSIDDLDAIWDLYPGHVIELTAFDREIGDIPGRNTVVWECRLY